MDQTPRGAWSDLRTQPRCKALGDIWVKIVEKAVVNISLVRLSPQEWPKVDRGKAKEQLKNSLLFDDVCLNSCTYKTFFLSN